MFYLFHHLPKTAGTSCINAFQTIFRVVKDYHLSTSLADLSAYKKQRLDLSMLSQNDIVCGHYNISGHYLYQRYPNLDSFGVKKIIFLRDPLETAKSGVRFGLKRGWYKTHEYDMALINRANYFSRMLQCTQESYREVIDGYWFVGITELLQDGFDEIAKKLGEKSPRLNKTNTTDDIEICFSACALDEFRKRSSLDFAIYEYSKNKFLKGTSIN